MRNIEIKARLADPSAARECAARLCDCGPAAEFDHIDTYFNCDAGRLKLREISGSGAHCELIFYMRPNVQGPRTSNYEIYPVLQPELLKTLLTAAYGVMVVVRKKRTLFLYENVRIHIDEVEGLGAFLEFEAVMSDGASDSDGNKQLEFLLRKFNIAASDLVEGSYSDMLRI